MASFSNLLGTADVEARTTPPRLVATVGAYLFFAGATATAVILLAEPNFVGETTGYWFLCLTQALLGFVMLASIRVRGDWVPSVLVFGGILIITAAIAISGERTQAAVVLSIFYVWPALYAGYFFKRPVVATVIVAIAVAYALALVIIDADTEAIVPRALVTVSVVAGVATVAHVVRRHVDGLVGRLDRLARVDPLTALVNRRGFAESFKDELERSRRTGQPLAVALGDIDRFKALNDRFGHASGDIVLQELGRTLLAASRTVDTVARLGGEEFAVLMPVTDVDAAVVAAERLRERVAGVLDPAGDPIQITFGVACTEQRNCQDGNSLLLAADRALYVGKSRAGNCTVRYESGMDHGTERPPLDPFSPIPSS